MRQYENDFSFSHPIAVLNKFVPSLRPHPRDTIVENAAATATAAADRILSAANDAAAGKKGLFFYVATFQGLLCYIWYT